MAIRRIPRKYLQRVGHLAAKLLSVFYLGTRVQCPVCQHRYRKFLPYGRVARENALCPNCLALERHRLLWMYLQERTSIFTQEHRMLHVAPEYCFIDRFARLEQLDYVTADLESPLADIKMDIHQMPFEANSFDSVLCNHVLEHVDNDLLALGEIYRVLKPGGWAIVQVPFFPPLPDKTLEDPSVQTAAERFEKYGQEDHVRLYGNDYQQRLQSCGFEVTADDFAKSVARQDFERYALSDEVIFFCEKPKTPLSP